MYKIMYREKGGKRWFYVCHQATTTQWVAHTKEYADQTIQYFRQYSRSRTFKLVKVK